MPGVAGFLLSIGIAADSNILVFERIKEEILWGKPKNVAVKDGFLRAWASIKASNYATFFTALILWQFGTGAVKSFAVTLAIGIITSLFTASFILKTLVEVFNAGNYRKVKN